VCCGLGVAHGLWFPLRRWSGYEDDALLNNLAHAATKHGKVLHAPGNAPSPAAAFLQEFSEGIARSAQRGREEAAVRAVAAERQTAEFAAAAELAARRAAAEDAAADAAWLAAKAAKEADAKQAEEDKAKEEEEAFIRDQETKAYRAMQWEQAMNLAPNEPMIPMELPPAVASITTKPGLPGLNEQADPEQAAEKASEHSPATVPAMFAGTETGVGHSTTEGSVDGGSVSGDGHHEPRAGSEAASAGKPAARASTPSYLGPFYQWEPPQWPENQDPRQDEVMFGPASHEREQAPAAAAERAGSTQTGSVSFASDVNVNFTGQTTAQWSPPMLPPKPAQLPAMVVEAEETEM